MKKSRQCRDFTPAEELALSNNDGRPLMVGVEGGVSTDPGGSRSHYIVIQGMSQEAINCWDAIKAQLYNISMFVGVSNMYIIVLQMMGIMWCC